ncbi:hypothetical protein JYU34_006256 [Plutella xylostella]|uniref:E3 ubiquitin-protein ligase listerin n=1 Tax=Plutella xylostella TaxID=51655 RepID=A0ABQ7QRM7_PLUXY|nr:hypothetical protein JYU34_006256 [Plutella xylostella]
MGGKVKQSQRTKNNVRPSSSGRSAELLSSGGLGPAPALASGLASAVTGKPLPALFPTLAAASTDHYLNTDFMLCIKKLNKKDPITKTKALQELTELVNKNTSEEAVALLPFWTRLYRTLSTDPDHKVREVTQVCHGAIAARCGRALGGSLRALLPPWLHAQHDTAPAAAAAAEQALRNTFPEKKLPEVISFCKAEVVAYLLENLIGNTEASLQNKGDSAEQVAVHYERIVIASLQGLQVLSLRLPRAHDAWLWAELRPLLDAGKFWKLPAGNSAQIRASFFSALGCILERFPCEFGAAHGRRTLRLLLQASRERAPWTCLLQLMHHAENWQQWLDDKNLLTKRIFEILENGGWGDAKNLSTMILPLLANLPTDLRTQQFYEKFFNALFIGLSKKAIFSSKSERQSWITSIAECLRYVSIQDEGFSLEVTTAVHRTWLEKILSTANDTQLRSHLIKYSVASMVSIIKYWLKQSKEDGGEKYDQLVRNFWQNVGSTVLGQIDKLSTDHEEIGHLIEGHILLMQALKTSFVQEPKKKQSIKFDIDTTDGTKEEETTEVCDISSLERYSHNLNETAYRICANYLEFAETKQVSEAVVTPLLTLIREFDSKQLFLAVARHLSASEEASVFGLYDGKLRVWLSGDTMRCTAVVDVVFVLLKHLSEDEQDLLLASFKQFPPSVVESCVSICVSHPHNTLASVKRFLHSRLAEESLVAATRRLLAGDSRARGLLLAALHAGDDSQMLISASAISSILSLFTSTLDPSLPTLQQCTSVAALVLSAVLADATGVEYRPLMCKLFYLNLAIKLGDGRLNAESWREARAAWLDGLAALSAADADSFVDEARGIVHRCRADLKKKLNLLKIEHMASLCPHLIRNLEELDPRENIEQIATFTKQLFEFPPEPQHTPVEFYALRLDCIKGNLQCPFDDDTDIIKKVIDESSQNTTEELSKEVLLSHVNKVLFRAFYLKTLMLRKVGGEDDDDDDEETGGEVWCDALLDDEYMSQQFATLLYDRAVLETLKEGYAFWPDYETITSALSRLNLLIDDIITATSVDARQRQWRRLRATAAADGYYWAYAARYYSVKCSLEEETQESDNLENTVEGLSGNGFFHSLQAATKSVPADDDDSILRAKFLLMVRAIFLAHAHDAAVLDAAWMSELARCRTEIEDNQPGGGLDVVVNLYYRHDGVMLYET